jgi:dTDP-4-amino-4,6-dideoxygalactose transaminase
MIEKKPDPSFHRNTNVAVPFTRPLVPDTGKLLQFLKKIDATRQLTNGGPVHEAFEQALCDYLGVEHLSLFANGTLALTLALRALDLQGEVITTPFTSPATLQAILWNNLTPVFADIHPENLNLYPESISKMIRPNTAAILPVHVFGEPCKMTEIESLTRENNLRVIYDAAHCFGVMQHGKTILNAGDMSVLSFHATKVFNTFEGGAVVCHDRNTKQHLDTMKNNGLNDDDQVAGLGLNAKMNELQAAVGLCLLDDVEEAIALRKKAVDFYVELLKDVAGVRLPLRSKAVKHNYAYMPVIINPDMFGGERDDLHSWLKNRGICTRRYFYPLVSEMPFFPDLYVPDLPVAKSIAANILCLPLFPDMSSQQIKCVVDSIRAFQATGMVCRKNKKEASQ